MELLSNSGPELREPSVQGGHAVAVSCELYNQTLHARPPGPLIPVVGREVASLSTTLGSNVELATPSRRAHQPRSFSTSPPASAAAVARPTSRPFASNRYSGAPAYPDKRGQE